MGLRRRLIVPKTYVRIQDRSLRNMRIVNDYISGESIIKISRKYSLTYQSTREIIRKNNSTISQ
jgi:Mor family transcriptional regulator